MKVTFVLPGAGHVPVGGFKVVYEYANRLCRRGHKVTIVHPALLRVDTPWREAPKKWVRYVQRKLDKSYRPDSWFPIDPGLRLIWVPSLKARYIPDADVVIATAWETAEWVSTYSTEKGGKYYLIQGLETWSGSRERVLSTWRLPLRKIVIARWLREIARRLGEDAVYIPNGLDFDAFHCNLAPEQRDPKCIMMLLHQDKRKGSADGLEAISVVRDVLPEIKVVLFGVSNGRGLPTWVEYHRNPRQYELRALYNQASIFIAPSRIEGWGLPPAEAMACGAAVIATEVGGHLEFAEDGKTALLVPPRDPARMAERILQLIRDSSLRIRLANEGRRSIRWFTWDRATDALEALMRGGSDTSIHQ